MLLVLMLAPFLAAFIPAVGAEPVPLAVSASFSPALAAQYWANSSVEVTLLCDPSENCSIQYRPYGVDVAYQNYTGPFVVPDEGEYSYDLFAQNSTANAFNVVSFGIDTTLPTLDVSTECLAAGDAGWCLGDVTVFVQVPTDSGSDIANVTCSIGEAIVACNDPCPECNQSADPTCQFFCGFTVSSPGANGVKVAATDAAGNVNATTFVVSIDAQPPEPASLQCIPSEATGWCQQLAVLQPAVDDASGIVTETCAIDGVAIDCLEGTVDRQGSFVFTSTATDASGQNATRTQNVSVDTLAPRLSITHDCDVDPARPAWCASAYTFNMSALDEESGLSSWTCELDGFALETCEGNVTGEGSHWLGISATDAAGLWNSTYLELGIDTTLPHLNVSLSCDGAGAWCSAPATILINASSDNGARLETVTCLVDGVEVSCDGFDPCQSGCLVLISCEYECYFPEPCASGCAFNVSDEGQHDVLVSATDASGKTTNASLVAAIDLTSPTPATLACAVNATTGWCRDLAVLTPGSDALSGLAAQACAIDGIDLACLAGPVDRQGSFLFTSNATDAAGNANATEAGLSVDTLAPRLSIATTCELFGFAEWCRSGYSFNMTASDPESGLASVVCELDNVTLDGCVGNVTTVGPHMLRITAMDVAGHTNTTARVLGVDTVRPTYTIPRRVEVGEDDGKTRVTFVFSEPMHHGTTEAAIVGASGWLYEWNATSERLNITAPATLPEGTQATLSIGTSATDEHGLPLAYYGDSRTVIVRGPRDYEVSTIPYAFVNITANGTDTGMYCDDYCDDAGQSECPGLLICGTYVQIPFGFTYSGHTYYELNISPNGFVTLGRSECISDYTPDPFPGTCPNLIAAYWEDLDTRTGIPGENGTDLDRILYHTIGEAPNRVFIVSWSVVHHFSQSPPLATFQLQLHEGTNFIEVHYERAISDSGDHMIGVINANASRHTTYAFRPIDMIETALRFAGPGTVGDTVPPTVFVTGDDGLLATPNATIRFHFSEPMDQLDTLAAVEDRTGWTATWDAGGTLLTLTNASVAEGETTLTLTTFADDLNGVRIAAPVARTVVRDTTPPTATALVPEGPITTENASVAFTFSEPMDTEATLAAIENASGWDTAWSADGMRLDLSRALVPAGSTTLTLTTAARDAHGVALAAPVAATIERILLDTTAPTVVVTGDEGVIAGPNATVVFTFSEPMDTNATLAALENASNWTATWDASGSVLTLTRPEIPLGVTQLTLTTAATDLAGNPLASGVTRTLQRDPPAPPAPEPVTATPPDAPTDLTTTLEGVDLTLSWSAPAQVHGAPVTSYQVHLDGVLVGEPTGTTFTIANLTRGATHTLAVRAVNSAGPGPAATTSVPLPPTSTLRLPPAPASGWYRSPPTLTFVTDPADAVVLVDTGAGETPFGPGFTLPPGETRLRWRATAGGLSERTSETSVQVDPEAPFIEGASISSPALTVGQPLDITARVLDAHSGVASVVALVGGTPFALAHEGDGSYRGSATPPEGRADVQVVATDLAGNEARASLGSVEVAALPEETETDETPLPQETGDAIPLEQTSTGGGDAGATPPTPSPAGTDGGSDTSGAPQESQEEATPPEIRIDQPTGAGAQGIITVRVNGFPQLERLRVVLIDPDGNETILSQGQEVTEWDTATVPDGYYVLEARLGSAPVASNALTIQSSHSGTTLATMRVLVRNEIAPPVETAAVVAGAVLFTAATHAGLSAAASASSSAASSTLGGAGGFDPLGFAQEVAVDAGQDKLRDKTKDKAALDRKRRIRSVVAAVIGMVLLGALWTFSEVDGWSWQQWLLALPLVGTAAALVTAMKYAAESALAYTTHARPRVRLWVAGTISLALSSIVFRNPFGYPAWVDETEESESRRTWRMQALRAIATLAGAAAFLLPFLALSTIAPWQFVSIGVLIALTNLATSAMPFGPLPGKDIWRWNKWLAVGVAAAGFAIYVAYAAALVPMWMFWALAVAGAVGYAGTMVYFRRTLGPKPRRVPVSVPVAVKDMDQAAESKEPAGRASKKLHKKR